jgi:hypothetical protein
MESKVFIYPTGIKVNKLVKIKFYLKTKKQREFATNKAVKKSNLFCKRRINK